MRVAHGLKGLADCEQEAVILDRANHEAWPDLLIVVRIPAIMTAVIGEKERRLRSSSCLECRSPEDVSQKTF